MEVRAIPVDVPEEFRRPVLVRCQNGETQRALGECALKLDAGLREANRRIVATDEILDAVAAGPK